MTFKLFRIAYPGYEGHKRELNKSEHRLLVDRTTKLIKDEIPREAYQP